ncbi:MAG: hypothetical protein MI923_02155 [Phycisphaerales bacterium]|nr:hypothetical protein [Phycisphaerales bacterium]
MVRPKTERHCFPRTWSHGNFVGESMVREIGYNPGFKRIFDTSKGSL